MDEFIVPLMMTVLAIVVATLILIFVKSQRSRLLIQGGVLFFIGAMMLYAANGVGSQMHDGRLLDAGNIGTSALIKVGVILILSALASWFLSHDFRLCCDDKGGTNEA